MDYDAVVNKFCEKRLWGNPEVNSAVSALFITYTGYVGFRHSVIVNTLCYHLLSLLIINGIGSFLYHWWGWYIFKHMDEVPMIVAVWFGIIHILNSYHSKLMFLLCDVVFVTILTINTIPDFQIFFPVLFGVPLASMVPLICYEISQHTHRLHKKKALLLAAKGIVMCCCSAILWVVSEMYCSVLLFFAHSLWHIGMALGLYHVIIALNYLDVTSEYTLCLHHRVFPVIKGPPLHWGRRFGVHSDGGSVPGSEITEEEGVVEE